MTPFMSGVGGALGLACAMLAGCGGDRAPESPAIADVFPKLPLPPEPTFISRNAGAEAIQITLRSPRPSHEIEKYYLRALSRDGWRVVNQDKTRDGELVLLAEQDGPPLWVRIRPTDDGTATLVQLAGAVVQRQDTAQARKPAS